MWKTITCLIRNNNKKINKAGKMIIILKKRIWCKSLKKYVTEENLI